MNALELKRFLEERKVRKYKFYCVDEKLAVAKNEFKPVILEAVDLCGIITTQTYMDTNMVDLIALHLDPEDNTIYMSETATTALLKLLNFSTDSNLNISETAKADLATLIHTKWDLKNNLNISDYMDLVQSTRISGNNQNKFTHNVAADLAQLYETMLIDFGYTHLKETISIDNISAVDYRIYGDLFELDLKTVFDWIQSISGILSLDPIVITQSAAMILVRLAELADYDNLRLSDLDPSDNVSLNYYEVH